MTGVKQKIQYKVEEKASHGRNIFHVYQMEIQKIENNGFGEKKITYIEFLISHVQAVLEISHKNLTIKYSMKMSKN